MKRLLIATLFCTLALPAMAQAPSDEVTLPECAQGAVTAYLMLAPEQTDSWEILIAEHEFAAEPLRQAIADVQAALEALFDQGSPDPAAVGDLVIERRYLGEELGEVHRIYVQGFEQMLDEEQAQKLHLIRAADRVDGFIPAFKVMGLTPFHPRPIEP